MLLNAVMCVRVQKRAIKNQILELFYRHIWRINTIAVDSAVDIFMELLRAIIAAIIFMLRVCVQTLMLKH